MRHRGNGERGQTIVIAALAMIPLLLLSGLVIDGGNAFSQQRRTQNAMDAAADAGAVVLVQNLPFTSRGQAAPRTDADVKAQIIAVAKSNDVEDPVPTAVYTDILGNRLDPVVQVGSLGGSAPPAAAYGVEVTGSIRFGTFFAGIAGMTGFTASAKATAVAGAITSLCASDEPCVFVPVTFPTGLTNCTDTGKTTWGSNTGAYTTTTDPQRGNEVIIPLCGTTDGSVGWLDVEPHNPICHGTGAENLACNIENPRRDSLPLPIWIHTQTGNVNSTLVQTALDAFSGPTVGTYEPGKDLIVQIPLYECIDNNIGQVSPGPACPNPPVVGVGSNTYYRIVAIASMILDKSYIQASNPECSDPSEPGLPLIPRHGGTGCLKGWLTQIVTTGQVGLPGDTQNTVWGVQLIR